eukprot:149897-Pleurochrysis_carterae.AAC.1
MEPPDIPKPAPNFVSNRRAHNDFNHLAEPASALKPGVGPLFALEERSAQNLACRALGAIAAAGMLLAAVLLSLRFAYSPSHDHFFPPRFSVTEWPVQRCPLPTIKFNESCAGVDFANGEAFVIELHDVHPEWQNLYVSAHVHSTQHASGFGIDARLQMEQTVLARIGGGGSDDSAMFGAGETDGGWTDISLPLPSS